MGKCTRYNGAITDFLMRHLRCFVHYGSSSHSAHCIPFKLSSFWFFWPAWPVLKKTFYFGFFGFVLVIVSLPIATHIAISTYLSLSLFVILSINNTLSPQIQEAVSVLLKLVTFCLFSTFLNHNSNIKWKIVLLWIWTRAAVLLAQINPLRYGSSSNTVATLLHDLLYILSIFYCKRYG